MKLSETHVREADVPHVDDVHDTIVIGSSPVLLLEALHLSRQGHRVTILESKPHLGGAWYGRDLWDLGHVDVGCHYIDRRNYTFRLLKEVLGLPCDRQRYDYLWPTGSPCQEGQAASSMMARVRYLLGKWLLAGRLVHADFWELMHKIGQFRLRKWPTVFADLFLRGPRLYPRGGAHAVVSAILAKFQENSIRVIREVTVDRVVVGEDEAPAVIHADKAVYRAARVVTGQNVAFRVLSSGKSLLRDRRFASWTHTVLRIEGNKQRPFDFIDLFKAPRTYLRRIQDVTPYEVKRSNSTGANFGKVSRFWRALRDHLNVSRGGTEQDLKKDDLLICCQHSAKHLPGPGHAEAVLEHLKQLRLLTEESRLVAWHCESYRTCCDDHRTVESEVEPYLPKEIRMMQTWDLGLCLQLNRVRWGSLA